MSYERPDMRQPPVCLNYRAPHAFDITPNISRIRAECAGNFNRTHRKHNTGTWKDKTYAHETFGDWGKGSWTVTKTDFPFGK